MENFNLTEKLPAEIKAKWLAALRSGNYTQTQGWLNRNNCFCCLGVLHDTMGGEWVEAEHQNEVFIATYKTAMFSFSMQTSCLIANDDSYSSVLDEQTRKALLQSFEGPSREYTKVQAYLAAMNDTLNNDFNEIADWIGVNL